MLEVNSRVKQINKKINNNTMWIFTLLRRSPLYLKVLKKEELINAANECVHQITFLSQGEKLVLLIGLLALHGDGEISQSEIDSIEALIDVMNFSGSVSHRDPLDQKLCRQETLAWVLTILKDQFSDLSDFPEEDLNALFLALVKSLEQEAKDEGLTRDEQRQWSESIRSALIQIANADGAITPNEKKLIDQFAFGSNFYLTRAELVTVWCCIAVPIIIFLM